ncbi:MAG: tRNA (adenosine(37)-N6)-threonylcarbamoyltransferase complex dimerization subunit type 1 TsaB [Rhodobacteraceae bacterium]|nr:tRNA (adenosine(37)-N6)-threonylcarbamoyltransferase complex dimerization subunit type 1 TsaB [Paracoccaceae bacterium]
MSSVPLALGFDTSAAHCAAVLLRGGAVLAHRFEELARGQAERLMPLLQEVLAEGGAEWGDLAVLGVGVGPGNFTGIRISVSAARGLALGLGIPAVGVSTLEAMALDASRSVLCSVDARRGMYYVQLFNSGRQSVPALCSFKDIPWPNPRAEVAVMGHNARELADVTGGPVLHPVHPLAEAIARRALRRMHNVTLQRPAPLYLRPADAAPPRQAPPAILP